MTEPRPEDATFWLDAAHTRAFVDVPFYIQLILQKEWKQENTDNKTPKVWLAEERSQAHRLDQITVYAQSEINQYVPIGGYQFRNRVIIVSLEFITWESREHSIKVWAEARRILDNHRFDTFGGPGTTGLTGRHWVRWGLRDSMTRSTDKGVWRRETDIEINERYSSVDV